MAISRTWYTEGNYANPDISSAANSAKSLLWSIKALLCGDVSGAVQGHTGARPNGSKWTVYGSCDASTAAFDSTDRWGSTFNASKIVNANFGTAHSWIVLKSPTGLNGGNTYLNLVYRESGDGLFVASFANTATGFGSPSITNDFTGPSDSCLLNAAPYKFHDGTASQWRTHLCVDDVGRFYMVWGKSGTNHISGILAIVDAANLPSGDVRPLVGLYDYDETFTRSVPTDTSASTAGGSKACGHSYNNGEVAGTDTGKMLIFSMRGIANNADAFSTKITTVSPVDGTVGGIRPVLVYSSASSKYIKGCYPDAYITGAQVANGSADPLTGNMEHVQIGNWKLPFNAVLSF